MTRYEMISTKHNKLTRTLSGFLAFLIAFNPLVVAAGSVVANGKTKTVVTTQGSLTSVTTSTISGNSGFNAFSQFDVDQAETVNLYLPGETRNLINLVYDKRSDINGVVNSIKDGAVGGNLFFANPYGLIVGKEGSINTGSLSLSAPSHSFMQSIFDDRGELAPTAVGQLMAGDIPLSDSGLISIKGKINAINDIDLKAANVEHSGVAVTGANFQSSAIDFSDLVNVNGVESAGEMAINNGVIEIFASQQLAVDGELHADGGSGVDAGEIYLDSDGDINLNAGAVVSAQGKGSNSSGGTIISMAQDTGVLAAGVQMNAAAGSSGDGGFIEFSAVEHVSLQGGLFNAGAVNGDAGLVYIDPPTIDIAGLNLLDGETNLLIEADDTVTVLDGAIVSSRRILDESNETAHLGDASIGDSGDITIWAPEIKIGEDVQILAHAIGDDWQAGDVLITNLRPIDVDSVDPTLFEIGGFSLSDILGDGNDLQGLIDSLGLDEKDVSRLMNLDSDVSINIGVDGGAQTIIRGDNVEVLAYASDRFGFEKNATAAVNIFNTDIQATNISILAEADTGLFPELFDNTTDLGPFSLDPNDLVDNYMDTLGLPDSAFYVNTTASAATTIGGALTTIVAQDQLDIAAKAINKANPFSTGKIVGLEIIEANTNASVEIKDQVSLDAAILNLTAEAETSTTADANAEKLVIPAAAAVSLNKVNALAIVSTDATTQLEASTLELKANSTTEVETTSTATSATGSAIVAAVAISDVTSVATAIADGTIVADSLDVLAEVESEGNTTNAAAGSDSKPGLGDKYNNLVNATQALLLTSLTPVSDGAADAFFPQMKKGAWNIAGAVAIAKTDNQATATLASTADATINGTATIKASIEDDVSIGASVAAETGEKGGLTAGGALTIGDYNNAADAHLAAGAILNAEDVDVDASTSLAYPWDFDYTDLGELYDKLSGGLTDLLFTGSAVNKMKSKGAGASASVNTITYDANAKAYIDDGATVTINEGGSGAVNIKALTDTNLVTVSGKDPRSAAESSGAIGGSVNVITVSGETLAYVADNAVVNRDVASTAASLNVDAEAIINTINIAESGGSGERVAIDGAVAYLIVDQNTSAYIESDASVTADSVAVDADTDVALWNIAGGFAKSEAVGVGLSFAFNDVDVTTRAYIGENDDLANAVPTAATVTADTVSVNAHADGVMDAISVAGALVSSSDESDDGVFAKIKAAKDKAGSLLDQATATVNAQRSSASSASSGSAADGSTASSGGASGATAGAADTSTPKPSFGVGISGAASVNEVAFITDAKLQQARVVTEELVVRAINEVDVDAGSGSASFTKAKASSVKNSAAFAGAFAFNDMDNSTTAKIASANVSDANSVSVQALSAGEQLSVGIGMAVNTSNNSGKSGSIAGSVSLSNSNNITEASIEDSTITGDDSADSIVDVVAYDKTNLGVGGGSLFYGGKNGFGAAVSLSEISNSVSSKIDNSTISQFDNLVQRSLNAAKIASGAAMAGGGSGTNSLAGSFVFAEIDNSTSATISGGSVVSVSGIVELLASDSSGDALLDLLLDPATSSEYDYSGGDAGAEDVGGNSIVAVAGLIQVGKNNVGVSLVKSDITNAVTTTIDGSTITATTIDADAQAKAAITGVAIGVGGGTGSLAANGSVALSAIGNETTATSNNSQLNADGININATDNSAIGSLAGNISASAKNALGAAVSVSEIDNITSATLQDGSVDTGGDVTVRASSDASIQTIAAAGGAGGEVAIGVSVTVNEINNGTLATVSGTDFIQTANNLSVTAAEDASIESLAGTINGAGQNAAGAAVSINLMENLVSAWLDSMTNLDVLDTVNVDANNDSDIETIAVAGGGAGTNAFNGSASVNVMANTTEARVTDVVSITQVSAINVNASDDSSIQSLAGAVGGAGTGAVGAAVAVNDLANTVSAEIAVSQLRAASIVSHANTTASIESMAVAGSGAGTYAVNGSVAVNFISNTTESLIDGLEYLEQGLTLSVSAEDDSDIDSLGGSVSAAGTTAVGAAVTVNDISNDVTAEVANSTINVSNSMSVDAVSTADIRTLAVAGGGSGTAAVGGSAASNNIANAIYASITDSDQINASADVSVEASDDSLIQSLAGSVQLSGTASVGAAAAVNRIGNQIWSWISGADSDVAGSDITVDSSSDATIETIAVGASVSGSVGVAGSVAVNLMDNAVDAHIDDGASVIAQNNVAVRADSSDDIDVLAGAVAIGGSGAGLGATVSVNQIESSTKAYISGAGTSVNALANSTDGLDLSNGISEFDFSDVIASQAESAENGEDGDGSSGSTYHKLDLASKINADTENTGVTINATSRQNIDSLGATAGVGLYGGLGATANVNVIGGETKAYIDTASVNDQAGADSRQNLAVVAEDHTYTNAFVGAIGGGAAGLGAAVDTTVIDRSTQAYIVDASNAEAQSDLLVSASATQGANSIAVGGAGGGVALAASGSVLKFDADTAAYIQDSDIDAGSVTVAAKADNQSSFYDFAAALGAAASGAGTFGVNLVNNRTSASITGTAGTPLVLRSAGAVNVNAESSTSNNAKVISFAASSGGYGVAGMAAVNVITSNTEAKVDNVDGGSSAARLASLNVTATDDITLNGLAGAAGVGGGAGIGAGATVNIVKSRVIADINNTDAFVNGAVTVDASSSKLADNITATAGAGLTLGVGGSALVNLFGAELEGDSAEELNKDNNGTLTKVDDLAGGNKTELLEGQDEGTITTTEIAALNTKTQSDVKTVATTESTGDSAYRTGAAIQGSSNITSGSVNVTADDATTATALVGGVAIGAVGVGGAFALTEVKNTITADITESVSVNASTVNLNASAGKVAGESHVIDTDVFAGAGGIVGVGAAVGIANIQNTVSANLAAEVSGNTAIGVSAIDSGSILVDAKGAAVGAGAVGVVVAGSEKNTNVSATVGGSNAYTDINSLVINAESSGRVEALSKAGAAGLFGAGTGADAQATDNTTVTASTADGSEFDLGTGSMTLSAQATPDIYANSIGVSVSGGVKIGASFAKAESNQTVIAALGAANQLTANTLSLTATNALSASGYSAQADAVGAGGGLLLGLNATNGEAVNTINVESRIGNGSDLIIGSALNVDAVNTSKQRADVTGINGGILAAGFNEAEATTVSVVQAYVGDDVAISGGNISITADSENDNYADSVSGSGGVVSGSASEANTSMNSITKAYIGDDAVGKNIDVDSLAINATHTSKFNAKVDSTNASLVGASGATASNVSDSMVEASLGMGLDVQADHVDVDAINYVEKLMTDWNVISGSGGLVDLPAASSTSWISNNTEVNVGADTVLAQTGSRFSPGTFEFDAVNDVTAKDKVKMNAGGAIALAKGQSIIHATTNNASVNVGDGAIVQALADLTMGAKANADISTTVAVDVFGLAGVPYGDAVSNFVAANAVNINDNAELLSLNDVILGAGVDTQGNENNINVSARSDLWNNSALPLLHDPVADALIHTDNTINIGTGADVAAVRHIVLNTKEGDTTISGIGIGKDIYSETLSEVVNGVGGAFGAEEVSFDRHGGSESNTSLNTVNVDGTTRVGIQSQLALEIDINGNVTRWVNGEVTTDADEGIRIANTYTTNVADDIKTRISDLRDLISEYTTDSTTSDASIAVAAYEAEITFLENKLEELGLSTDTDGGGFNGVRKTQLELAEIDLESFNTQKNAKETEQTGYETENSDLAVDNTTLAGTNSTLTNQNTTLTGEVVTLTSTRDALDPADYANNAAYQADYDSYTTQIDSKNSQISGNSSTIAINESTITSNESTIVTNSGLISVLQTDIDGLDSSIVSIETGIDDGIYLDSVDSLDVNVLVIDDTTAQLGNIYVSADTLGGDGQIIAPGDAEIVITNNSANYLELNDLIIPADDGGKLYFNNVSVTDNAEINDINTAGNIKSILAGMSVVTADFDLDTAEEGALPKIEIISNYDPTLSSNASRVPNVGPDIILSAGDSSTELTQISNTRGSVLVQSASGNIRLEENTLVSGATVEVKARNGDFIQSYTDAFSHIVGGEPLTFIPADPNIDNDLSDIEKNTAEGSSNGVIANGSVLIAARYLNINGTVQSGIPEWGVSIPSNTQVEGNRTFDQAQTHYDSLSAAEKAVDGAEFYTVIGANVSDLGAGVWGDWEQITVEYNAKEDRLELGGVQVKGGYIQLFGQIFNTNGSEVAGNASLRVLDGYGEINVDNQTDKALFLNTLDAGQGVEGKISITNIVGQAGDGSPILEETVFTRNGGARTGTSFDPDAYLTGGQHLEYSMSNGSTSTTVEKYLYVENSWFNSSALTVSEAQSGTWLSSYTADEDPLAQGEFLKVSTNTTYDSNGIQLNTNNETTSQTLSKDGDGWVDCNWWTICANADHYQRYKIETGLKTVNTYSVDAGNPIAIEFIGFDEGAIDVSSTADVLISGALINRSGDTSIVSRDGSILQTTDFATVTGNNISLTANQGIGTLDQAINVAGLDNGVLSAVTNTGDISITKETGNLDIAEVSTNNGRVLLDVDGDINGVGTLIDSSGDVVGNRIELISRNGAIGTDRALKIKSGYTADLASVADYGLEALARDDISIVNVASTNNTEGHLMLVNVESLAGDVTLQTEGTMIDNNQIERSDTRAIDDLVALWDDMQLRGASADAKDVREIEILEDSVTAEYRRYWNTRLSQEDPSTYDPNYVVSLSADQETVMRAQLALRDSDGDGVNNTSAEIDGAITSYIDDRTIEFHEQHARLYDPSSENAVQGFVAVDFVEDYRYTAAETEITNRTEGSHWSDFQLALSVSPSLLKELTDTVTVIEEPNVKGKHVTLISDNGDIGTITPISFDVNRDNALDFTIEEKAALAAAERGDITVFADSLTIQQRDDTDVELTADGSLSAQANAGDVYLGSEEDVAVAQISAGDEIRLKVAGDLTNFNSDLSLVNITGQRTILEAAHGVIGAADKALLINLGADAPLTARAAGSIYIAETDGNINVDTLFSREKISLLADGSIVDAFDDSAVNVSASGITLTAGEDVGEDDDALDIVLVDGTVVDVEAGGNVALNGEATRLGLGSINAANVQIELGVVGGYLNDAITASGSTSINGSGAWQMFEDSSVQSAVTTIDIAGDLLMAAGSSMTADQMSLNSGGIMELNDLASSDVLIVNASSDINMLAAAEVSSDGDMQIDAAGALLMEAGASMTAGQMTLNSSGQMVLGDITTSDSLMINAGDDINTFVTTAIDSDGDIQIDTEGSLTMLDGSIIAAVGTLEASAAGDITVANMSSQSASAEAVSLTAGQEIIDGGDIDTDIVALDGGLVMSADDGIGIGNPLEVNVKFATVNAENGDVIINSDTDLELNARAENGSVIASVGGVLTTDTGIYASDSANLTADEAIDIDPLTVGVSADLTSEFINAMITQTAESEAPLALNIVGLSGQATETNLQINATNGVVFNQLWSQDANIIASSDNVTVQDGQSDQQLSVSTPLTAMQVENRSVVRKPELDLQLYSKDKAYSFVLNNGTLTTNEMVIGNSTTHSVDSPLGKDKDVMRYFQEILQAIEPETDTPAVAEFTLRVLDGSKDQHVPLVELPEEPSQFIQLDKQAFNGEEKTNVNNVEQSSNLTLSAAY